MIDKINNNPQKYYIYPAKQRPTNPMQMRSRSYEREITTEDKLKAGIGAAVGTIIPLVMMMKKQNVKNPFKVKFGLYNMILMAGTSIAGGVAAGMIGENKQTNKNKLKEGVFQFLNASIPTWLVGSTLKLAEGNPKLNNIPVKIVSMVLSLFVGMFGTAAISNLIFDPKDKEPDRKLTLKDCLVNIDDAIGVLVLAKFPFVDKLHLESILPAIFGYCGYRAGKSN